MTLNYITTDLLMSEAAGAGGVVPLRDVCNGLLCLRAAAAASNTPPTCPTFGWLPTAWLP